LLINGHFGQGRLFFIYAFDEQGGWLHALRRLSSTPQTQEPNEVRAQLLSDCHCCFVKPLAALRRPG
jgi:nitrogen fixation protein NifX